MISGQKFKELRLAANLTAKQVADKMGVAEQTISKYENETVRNIPSDRIETMARLYGVSPAYIMEWEDNFDIDTDIIVDMMKDRNTINHVATLLKLNQINQNSVFDMIDFLAKKEGL